MIISQATITMSEGILPPMIFLDGDRDKIVDSAITGGEIATQGNVQFLQCHIATDEKPTILGELSPDPMGTVIKSCRITGTKLPDAYYAMCYFKNHLTNLSKPKGG